MDAATCEHLGAAVWPHLEELDLSCTEMSLEAFEQLCFAGSSSSRRWPALTHLTISGNDLCSSGLFLPASMSGLASQLKMFDLSHNHLTARAIWQLTLVSWPCLECLYLRHTSTAVDAMSNLVKGRWPKLVVLAISGVAVGAPSLQVLRRRSNGVRHLHVTVNLGNAAVFKLFTAECECLQQLRYLQKPAAYPFSYFVMERLACQQASAVRGSGSCWQLPKHFAELSKLKLQVQHVASG